ncbi:MAG: GIY-YIG nuclease family protein [Alphaproteobacteria bacterium]|nr:GIY-YIG nuclease family protein [Alphaproteobacteria bacterium]
MKTMYVYIMANENNTTLYVGVTNNLIRRVWEHKNDIIEGFSSKYKVHKLVYFEIYEDEISAISREKQLKLFRKIKKIDLICRFNPNWNDLYDSITK